MPVVYLILSVSLSLSVSFLCSILEAALLSASNFDLAQQAQQGNAGARRLLEIKRKRLDEAISAILTYNTIAHTVGATLSGYFAAEVFGDSMVGVFSAVLTILILIVTEIIPKTLGTVHAIRLAGFVGQTVNLMMLPPMSWLLVVLRSITRLIADNTSHHRPMTRRDILAVVQGAARDNALATEETRAVTNLLRLAEVTATDVMTPRTVTFMLEEGLTIGDALAQSETHIYSRIPVYAKVRDQVRGYVLTRDLLWGLAESTHDRSALVSDFVRPIVVFPEETSVAEVLRRFSNEREQLAIVTDEHGGTAGLITMEDVIETALGFEIVDEFDHHVDLRSEAVRLRDQRLTRLEQERTAFLKERGLNTEDVDQDKAVHEPDPAHSPPE